MPFLWNKMALRSGDHSATLLQTARDRFASRFGRAAVAAASAPGRINLIGDHIDYCDGYVLPAALQFSTLTVGSYNGTSTCNILSITDTAQELEISFTLPVSRDSKTLPSWAQYVAGVVFNFPGELQGFDAVIVSDVPMGSGVSSSAAFEVSTFTFLEALTGTTVDPVQKALACQKAEHEFAGMPCGIMDQFISAMGKKGHALLIDCRSLEAFHIPMALGDVDILVINSNVKHQLTGSEYPQRRQQCQRAAELMGKKTLREAGLKDLEVLKHSKCDAVVVRRAEHVITEIQRTEEAAKSVKQGDLKRVGELFYESHVSLSRLMEVSCAEMDQLVEICRSAPGVLGARMSGGGFGGCVVALVQRNHVDDLKRSIKSKYEGSPTFFECIPSNGAKVIKLK